MALLLAIVVGAIQGVRFWWAAQHNQLLLDLAGDTWLLKEDLAILSEFPQLNRLTLVDPGLGDLAFGQICKNTALEHLEIDLPKLSDKGFVACCQLSRLKSLHIQSALLVTDDGLSLLHTLPELTSCKVRNTAASPQAIDAIMKRCALNKMSQAGR